MKHVRTDWFPEIDHSIIFLFFFFFLEDLFIFLWNKDFYKREKERWKDLPTSGSFPKCPQKPEMSWSEVWNQEFLLGLPWACRGSRTWAIFFCFPTSLPPNPLQKRKVFLPCVLEMLTYSWVVLDGGVQRRHAPIQIRGHLDHCQLLMVFPGRTTFQW